MILDYDHYNLEFKDLVLQSLDELDTFSYKQITLNHGKTKFDRDLMTYYTQNVCGEAE